MSYQLEADELERKLFVAGLNKANTDEDVLKNYFESYGNVIDCTIIRDQDSVSRGFGFILFEDAASVDKVMNAKKDGDEFSLDDHHLKVKRALPKVPGGNTGSSRTNGLNRQIFVRGLPSIITEQDLRSYFESYGCVNEIELLRDRETSKLRGFAFVTFDEEDSADKCILRRQHEICKKICEVKRSQGRPKRTDQDGNHNRFGFDRGDPQQQNIQLPSATTGGMSAAEVNQLIRQAFILGQQSVQGTQLPTAASLLNRGTSPAPAANNSILLQALMNQQVPAPAPAPPVASANNSDFVQLAQLLQSRGIDANSLAGLLKNDAPAAPAPAPNSYNCNYSNKTSNYGPAKDNGKRAYQPY